jgi:hypothetical protein
MDISGIRISNNSTRNNPGKFTQLVYYVFVFRFSYILRSTKNVLKPSMQLPLTLRWALLFVLNPWIVSGAIV